MADGVARMLAAVLEERGQGPRVQELPVPVPAAGEVLVRVDACGLCGSDLFLADGGFGSDVFPVIPGHEAAGTVVAIGQGVPSRALGRLVALYYISNDARSRWVRAGKPNLGPDVRRMGIDTHGGLAEFVVRPWSTCLAPREPIDAVALAVLTDAVATPFHALTAVAHLRPEETVVVLGVGGVGSNAVQLAVVLGATVIAVARSRRSQDLAQALGAHHVIAAGSDVEEQLRHHAPDGADVVVQCADGPGLNELAIRLAGPAGRVVIVAASHTPFPVVSTDLIWKELQVAGSRGFTPADVLAVQQLHLEGRLSLEHLTHDVRPLSAIAGAFEDLRQGRSTRIVITPGRPR